MGILQVYPKSEAETVCAGGAVVGLAAHTGIQNLSKQRGCMATTHLELHNSNSAAVAYSFPGNHQQND